MIDLLLHILDEAFERSGWHGPTLLGALRGVSASEAAWRPSPDRHSIWVLAVHTAYWKYTVRRRLTGEKRGSFAKAGSNFFPVPDPATEAAWKADVALIRTEHARLREVVAGLDPKRLNRRPPGSKDTAAKLIYGVAAHDAYHTGQIQLLKRLQQG